MTFLTKLSRIINTGQSRSVILTGNVYDLFFDGQSYVPLVNYLKAKLQAEPKKGEQKGISQVTYQVNRPIEFGTPKQMWEADSIWSRAHIRDKKLSDRLEESNANATYAFEILRQLTECSSNAKSEYNLLVIIEAADMLLPENEISRMAIHDRRRVGIVHDWFSNPTFMDGHDSVILISESRSLVHHRISRLPSVLSVEIPLPNLKERFDFIEWMAVNHEPIGKMFMVGPIPNGNHKYDSIAEQTAGLSLHAIRQLLLSHDLSPENIAVKVEEYMVSQLGEGVIEFKRPQHSLDSVVGFSLIKKFLQDELIPGFKATDNTALSGAAISGPIGGGKTYICEAVASELGIPVIVLKNIRSKWFGETDQIFERLRRLLEMFHKIVIFVDEADTMFGDIQSEHDTERRLTGKIQSMMSDPMLKGKVVWFLMTARIHRLSPDIRRPGRMDLIIPILDPEGDDLDEFIRWAFADIEIPSVTLIRDYFYGYSPASFSMLRSRIKSEGCKTVEEALDVAKDIILPDIGDVRRYQSLQAKVNCTRRSLLVDKDMTHRDFTDRKKDWDKEISLLESKGIK